MPAGDEMRVGDEMGQVLDQSENAAVNKSAPIEQLKSAQLFRHGNTVRIEHAGETYWLRLTRGNKLILTK